MNAASWREYEREVQVRAGGEILNAILAVPGGARGLVIFAHGSGSGRNSPRNRYVADQLNKEGIATLLLDLLTEDEEAVDRVNSGMRFDIGLLAKRLIGATEWAVRFPATASLRVGYFGSSTGAAAALVAAAQRPDLVSAVVSRGGRPDLSSDFLKYVRAPCLFIVGGEDTQVLEMSAQALENLRTLKSLVVIPGATHLFPEPGALDRAADLAARWFARHLTDVSVDARV